VEQKVFDADPNDQLLALSAALACFRSLRIEAEGSAARPA
jgi:hypothetical protein